MLKETASQTAGPYLHIGMMPSVAGLDMRKEEDARLNVLAGSDAKGERIRLEGTIIDGEGVLVRDAQVEIWQANAGGRYRHVNDHYVAAIDPNFGGCGRCITDADGWYRFRTIKPGPYPWRNRIDDWRPAHIHFSLFGHSFVTRLITQLYFEGDPLLQLDPIYHAIPDPEARERLIARLDMSAGVALDTLGYRFDIVLRGRGQTPFENKLQGS